MKNKFYLAPIKQTTKRIFMMKQTFICICIALSSVSILHAQNYQSNNLSQQASNTAQAQYTGGNQAMLKFIDLNLRVLTPADQGTLKARFEVDKMGYIKNARIISNLNPETDAEALRLISSMPRWQPAQDATGKTIETEVELPIQFKSQPQFEGGQQALQSYINANKQPLTPPAHGTVCVVFEVDAQGNIKNAEVTKGLSQEANAEALRLVEAMPKWQPATINEQPVSKYYQLPISF